MSLTSQVVISVLKPPPLGAGVLVPVTPLPHATAAPACFRAVNALCREQIHKVSASGVAAAPSFAAPHAAMVPSAPLITSARCLWRAQWSIRRLWAPLPPLAAPTL